MNVYYTYLLIDPRNNLPFYVGKGKGNRCYAHKDEAVYYKNRKSLKLSKIRSILKDGFDPIVKKVEENVSDSKAIDFECLLIAELKDLGVSLTNMTEGGDGVSGYKHTEEHKKHMSSLMVHRVFSEETKQKMRKPKSEQGRINIAKARKESTYRPSEETKKKMSDSLKGRPSAMKGKTHSEEAKLKMSRARKVIPKPKIECPQCAKLVAINTAKYWHFDNCKERKDVCI